MSCLFDEDDADEVIDPALAWSRKLVVGQPFANPEDLNTLEEMYRHQGVPPIIFTDVDDNGNEIFENPEDFARAMGLAPGTPVTMDQAQDWIAQQSAAGRWAS
jgi:hypothetical protein